MHDHALNKYPDKPSSISLNTLLLFGLIGEDERSLFTKYAEPDEPCFSSVLRARGYAIWHNPTKTRVFAREWTPYRVTLTLSEDDLIVLPDLQPHLRPLQHLRYLQPTTLPASISTHRSVKSPQNQSSLVNSQ